jgi:ribonucleoside-triphosphate reductase
MVISVIKRNGNKVDFDKNKIAEAILKANKDVQGRQKASVKLAKEIARNIENFDKQKLTVEEIQDMVEKELMSAEKYDLAKAYILYREKRAMIRQSNTTDISIKELIDGTNDYWNTENSNKNAKVVTTQRDYLAGITSTDITRRFLLPEDVVKAHDEGIIHFHDADYFAQNALHNCELVNLNDMLQNGTVINGVMIEKPHRFITAATIATQIILAVTSSSYGGCTVTLSHLAPFVRDSYNRFLKRYQDRGLSEEQCKEFAMQDTKKEIADGVQTFNYQVNSMTNTNGQAPFLSVCMYLGETEEYKDELAMIIEEFLKQRILGFKNEKGVYVTPAFPKLLYVLEEDNIHEDSKYWYLTELAAKCTAKRMVPDYISEKIMLENKINQWGEGDCYPCMRM